MIVFANHHKKTLLTLWAVVVAVVAMAAEEGSGTWDVIPLPRQVTLVAAERPFAISEKTVVACPGGSEAMVRNARFLVGNIRELTGIAVQDAGVGRSGDIVLALDPSIGHPEGYRIRCSQHELRITGATEAAVFYGVQTLTKTLPVARRQLSVAWLPATRIEDAPRYSYRGFLLDVSRHYFPVDDLKRLIDMLALHHVNYLHWHLTDDQGWRIEIKKYPRLETVGQHRRETLVKAGTGDYDGTPVSGFYTQEDCREIVRYAGERQITVVPEIDLPGHMLAALASYPHLGCTGGPYEVACGFGVFGDVLCGGSAEALQFAKDVISEVMDVFPSPYIHIGGDECPKVRWQACPRCQAKVSGLGLTDEPGHSKEDRLQAWFMGEVEKVIAERGRQMVGWDEILDGKPSPSSVVMAWTSPEARLRSAREGHPTIVCPITHFYFSNPHWNRLTGRESIGRVYGMEPSSPDLTPDENRRIIGAEGCIWTEWVKTREKLEWQLLPRLAALAEVQWTPLDRKNFDGFMRRLPRLVALYEHYGWNYKHDILD